MLSILLVLFFFVKRVEKYKNLNQITEFPLDLQYETSHDFTPTNGDISDKYQDHRYVRHRTRNNFLNQKNYY